MTNEEILHEALYDAGYEAYKRGEYRRHNPIRTSWLRDEHRNVTAGPKELLASMWDVGWEDAMKEANQRKTGVHE